MNRDWLINPDTGDEFGHSGANDGVLSGTTDHRSSDDQLPPMANCKLQQFIKRSMEKAREEYRQRPNALSPTVELARGYDGLSYISIFESIMDQHRFRLK